MGDPNRLARLLSNPSCQATQGGPRGTGCAWFSLVLNEEATAAHKGTAVDTDESLELGADELVFALVELDLGLRLRYLVGR